LKGDKKEILKILEGKEEMLKASKK